MSRSTSCSRTTARRPTLLAEQLEALNRERQGVEERILREAVARVDALPPAERARRGYVLWDEGWHEGVIGIVASRLVERFHRPVVLIARSGEGWKGSGRSIPDFDLHAGLAACAEHLERFGGHRAAAGLSIETEQLEAFADAFGRHADAELADDDLRPVTTVDAIVPATALTLDLAQELDRLAPFGLGNPELTLLVASVEATGAGTVGEGKHLRFRVRQQGRDGGSRDRLRARRPARAPRRAPGASTSPSGSRRTAGTGRSRRSSSCGACSTRPAAYDELRAWLAEQWRAGEDGLDARGARGSSPSSVSRRTARGEAAAARVGELPGAARSRRRRAAARRVGRRRTPARLVAPWRGRPRPRRRSTRACRGASSGGRGRRRARSRPCRCRGRRRSPASASSRSSATRAVSSPRHVTLCAPSGPGGKQTMSPVAELVLAARVAHGDAARDDERATPPPGTRSGTGRCSGRAGSS